MICGNCGSKTKLVKFGLISFSLCYECLNCEHREVYKLGVSEETREDVKNHLDNIPYERPSEELEWLEKLDLMILGVEQR